MKIQRRLPSRSLCASKSLAPMVFRKFWSSHSQRVIGHFLLGGLLCYSLFNLGCALEPLQSKPKAGTGLTSHANYRGGPDESSSLRSPASMGEEAFAPSRTGVSHFSEAPQFKPRLLIIKSVMDEVRIPKDWQEFAEIDVLRSLESSGSFVVLKPQDIGLDLKDFLARGQWDIKKLQDTAREKAIPLVLRWELMPLQIKQETDPVGIARERRRSIGVQLKAEIFDSRKGQMVGQESGVYSHQEKEVVWWSKNEGRGSVADVDRMTLEFFLRNAVADLIPKLLVYAPKISWSGRVAMIKGDRLYLNVGQQSGVQVGDLLKVLDKGDEIFDPETGESIGKVQGRMKGTLEVISFFGKDGSIAVVHSGAGFQENDSIEYY